MHDTLCDTDEPVGAALVTKIAALRSSSEWVLSSSVPLQFPAYHPQGLVRHEELWWVTTVDTDGIQGHLIGFDDSGGQHVDLPLGDNTRFHPGGFDVVDGVAYIPVGEYRPHSTTGVWRVDLITHETTELFRVEDHLGVITFVPGRNELVAMTWGSREIWQLSFDGAVRGVRENPNHFIDIQDNQLLSPSVLFCSGVTFPRASGTRVGIGGVGLLDLENLTWLHEVPVVEHTATGRPITSNPVRIELDADGSLMMSVIPDDAELATLLQYKMVP